jgi:hypothetical protein
MSRSSRERGKRLRSRSSDIPGRIEITQIGQSSLRESSKPSSRLLKGLAGRQRTPDECAAILHMLTSL